MNGVWTMKKCRLRQLVLSLHFLASQLFNCQNTKWLKSIWVSTSSRATDVNKKVTKIWVLNDLNVIWTLNSLFVHLFKPFLAALAALYLPCWFIHWLTILNSYQTIPTLVVFALPSTMPHTLMSIQCRTQCSGIIISIRFHNFDRISQFWVDFTVLTKFLKIDKSSQFSAALAPLYVPLTDSLLWI